MINEQLLQYIKSQREAGTADSEIKENLQAAGWKEEDINEGFEAVSGDGNSPQSHQQMRKQAADDRDEGDANAASQNQDTSTSQSPDSKQAAGANPQASNSNAGNEPATKQSDSQPDQDADAYREPVSDADKQGAGPAGPQQSAANEDPTPLRTMEEDRKQAQQGSGGPTQSEAGANDQKQSQSKQARSQGKDASSRDKPSKEQGKQAQNKQTQKQRATRQTKNKTQQKKAGQRNASQKKTSKKQTKKKGSVSKMGKKSRSQSARKSPQKSGGRKQRSSSPSRIQDARQQSSSSSVATIILSILGLLLVGGGAAYAYVTYFQGPSANTNAQAVLQSLTESGSFQYRIGISAQSEDADDEFIVEGAVDTTPNTEGQTYYTIQNTNESQAPITGLSSEFAQYPELDQRQQQRIQEALANQQFMSVGEFQTTQLLGATENSSGFETQRFGVSVNPSQLYSTYATVYQAVAGESLDPELANQLRDTLGGFTPQQGQLWVHPTSSVPYQITVIGNNQDGETLQVNAQFKNHGDEITTVADTYEERSFAAGLGEYLDLGSTNDGQQPATGTTTDTSTSSDPTDTDPPEETSTPTDDQANNQSQRQRMRRQDQVRMNDIQQIVVALRVYANNNGEFPPTLRQLAGGEVLSEIPRDPVTNQPYTYAVTSTGSFHVGATLRATSPQQLPSDDNFSSVNTAPNNGFSGAAEVCGSEAGRSGSTCFDQTGQVNQ